MLPLSLKLNQVRLRWHQAFEAACSVQPLQLRTRTLKARTKKDGTVVPARVERYFVQPKVAPTTAKDLGADLLTMAFRAVERQRREPGFDFDQVGSDGLPEVPSIAVNCRMLAERRSMSSRTIRTHIDVLLRMGFLTRKAWHGTRADFEVWINPKYLWETLENPVENDLDRMKLSSILEGEATKFPLSVARETLETEELETSLVEKLLPHEAPRTEPATPATLSGNTGPQPSAKNPGNASEMASAGARRGPRAERRAQAERQAQAAKAPAAPQAVSQEMQKRLVMALWAYARPRLYANVAFDEEQHRKAQIAIWRGVFAAFRVDMTLQQWELYLQQALERVDLVADWLKRNTGFALPAPYAEVVQGRGYFDRENEKGFVATEQWHARKMANQYQYRIAEVLRRAGAELRGYRLKTASKRVLALTYSQLYHKHLKKVQALGCPQALEKFYILVAGGKH